MDYAKAYANSYIIIIHSLSIKYGGMYVLSMESFEGLPQG